MQLVHLVHNSQVVDKSSLSLVGDVTQDRHHACLRDPHLG